MPLSNRRRSQQQWQLPRQWGNSLLLHHGGWSLCWDPFTCCQYLEWVTIFLVYLIIYWFCKEQIEQEFPFFPTLHHIFASRPNVTPIVITTALRPQGQKTVWYQPPDNNSTDNNSNIDPELLKESVPSAAGHPTPQQEWSFGHDASGFVNADAPGVRATVAAT